MNERSCLNSAHVGHAEIEQHDVGPKRFCFLHRIDSVECFAAHVPIGMGLDQ